MSVVWDLIALFFRIVGAICFFLSGIFAAVALFNFIRETLDVVADWFLKWLAKKEGDQ